MQRKLDKGLRIAFCVLLSVVLLALLSVKYGCAQTQIAPFSTEYANIYKTLSTNINGEMFPAQCGQTAKPSWCTGSTADAWIRAACGQLPSTGGTINLLGLTGNIVAPVTCSTHAKQVIMLEDPASTLTITEADGGLPFPLDDSSMLLGPGAGQCVNNATVGGIHLASTANVTAIVGPAHTDGTQENFTASGLCLFGAAGATVSQGLLYSQNTFANTTFADNNVFICNTACMKILNGGGYMITNDWLDVTDGINSITGVPLIIQGAGLGNGCNVGPVTVSGGQFEHALGGNPEITIEGDGGGLVLACNIYVHDVNIERNPSGSSSAVGVSITDCKNCSVENIVATGVSAGAQDMFRITQNFANSIQNVAILNASNIFGTYENTLNDTTTNGIVLPFASQNFIQTYYSNPGYTQVPVLPGTTIQALGSDLMAGLGNFATGSGTFGTDFAATGCQSGQGLTCTYTRTNATAPPGSTFSQEVQITGNTDTAIGFNGVEYAPSISFTAGQTYIATFYGKGDGTFTGLPTFLLWNSVTPTFYCQSTSDTPFTTTWTLYTFLCTPHTSASGTNLLAIAAETGIGATGTFWLGGFSFSPIEPLSYPAILSSLAPYGIGPATSTQLTTTINGVPCLLGGSCSAGGGVPSVNTLAQPLVLSFSAGAGSCTSGGGTQTCTITGSSTGGGTVTNFIASSGSWPTWLVPSVATSTTTPTLSVSASAIPNSALANSSFTLGSTSVSLGATVTSISGLTLSSPTLTTPALGTPTALVLTNATGLPWAGLSGSPSTSQVPFQTLTTTGTTGPATLISGVLNIPQYATSGGGTQTICSGTLSLGTSAIASGTAASTVTAACTGIASTDNIMLDFNGNPLSITGFIPSTNGMLGIVKWPTTNTINVGVFNNTSASVTPGAVTLNYRVVR